MNRRDIDKLVDEEQAFFHASDKPLPVGEVLVSKGSIGYTPSVVDAVRPSGMPIRNEHLFMVRDPSCLSNLGQEEEEYLYKVTPVAPVHVADFGWIKKIADRDYGSLADLRSSLLAQGWHTEPYKVWGGGEVDLWVSPDGRNHGSIEDVADLLMARNYWSAVPTESCQDEYLTMAFRVDKRVK